MSASDIPSISSELPKASMVCAGLQSLFEEIAGVHKETDADMGMLDCEPATRGR